MDKIQIIVRRHIYELFHIGFIALSIVILLMLAFFKSNAAGVGMKTDSNPEMTYLERYSIDNRFEDNAITKQAPDKDFKPFSILSDEFNGSNAQ